MAQVFNEEDIIGIGYGFILSQSGQFISHPLSEYLTGPKGAESVVDWRLRTAWITLAL